MYKIAFVGGHITTAQAVIEEILETQKFVKSDLVFLGKKREFGQKSIEQKIIEEFGIDFFEIFAIKFNRFFSIRNFLGIFIFPFTILQSVLLLFKLRPKIIFAFGGYLSLPICIAGKIIGSKIFIHEGTVLSGAANHFISHFANRVMISFPNSAKFYQNAVLTGCPLRKCILNVENVKSSIPILFIAGGHSGSRAINSCFKKIISELLNDFLVVHQTGLLDFEKMNAFRRDINQEKRIRYVIKPFFNDQEFATFLSNSNVFVGRSGINTVSEVIFLKKASIFIPLPFAQKNEQFENARVAVSLGLSEIIEQKNLNADLLKSAVYRFSKKDVRHIDTGVYESLFKNASKKICELIYEEKI